MTRLERMKSYLPEHFAESREIQAILEDGNERFEETSKVLDDVLNQFFVETATWGLPKWEDELEIMPTETELRIRRSRVISKLTNQIPANYRAIEKEVNQFLRNPSSRVRQLPKTYVLEINIPMIDVREPMAMIIDAVEEMKPAHLNFTMLQRIDVAMKFGTALLSGEEITVYPWQPTEIETTGNITLGAGLQSFESLTVYPV